MGRIIINAVLGNVHMYTHTVHEKPAPYPRLVDCLMRVSRRKVPDPTEETNEGVERSKWWSRSQGGRSGWSPGSGDEVALAHREMVDSGVQQGLASLRLQSAEYVTHLYRSDVYPGGPRRGALVLACVRSGTFLTRTRLHGTHLQSMYLSYVLWSPRCKYTPVQLVHGGPGGTKFSNF